MKLIRPLLLGATAAALVAGTALPASADGPTDTTFTITSGALAVTPTATAALNDSVSGTTAISGSLGAVAVDDARAGTANWNVSATSTAFTGPLGSSSTAVSYVAGAVTETGTITVADGSATTLTGTAASVVAPTAVSGDNTASWAPILTVTMPANALADDYSGTVTTSIV